MKLQFQEVSRLTAQKHSLHKYLKILSDLTISGIYIQLQFDSGVILIDLELR